MNTTLTPRPNRSTGPANPSMRQGAVAAECIHDVVSRQVDRTPDALAVSFSCHSLTYRELDERANQLAHVLRRKGVGPDTFVAVCVERSLEMTIALLAVLKAGGAYLPLDPAYPAARLAHMIAHTSPVVLLLQEQFGALAYDTNIARVVIDAAPEIWANESTERPISAATPRSLAYTMYTSGSTGVPRAVLIEHHGVVNHNLAVAEYFELRAGDRVSQCGSLAFDIAVEEIFPTWMTGATVVLHPPGVVGPGRDFCRWLVREKITVVDLPTALWHEWVSYLAEHDDPLPDSLRLVVVGGQKASAQVLHMWQERTGPRIRWVNGYGPTEASIAMIFYSPDDEGEPPLAADADVPIGRALAGTIAYILRADGQPVEAGESGEICIGGVCLARGYLQDAAGTARKFVADPFSAVPGARMYRTGDLARVNAAGLIEFGGRTDDQVKVRGFRVELGDVENAFRQHPAVHDVVVVARETKRHDKQLAAYVVLKHGSDIRVADLLRSLKAKLPAHMVPANTMILDALPLTPTGKTDKNALPDIRASRDIVSADFVAPETDVQRILADIWSNVLGIDGIGIHDNFFELGGHSLRAAQVAARIRNSFGMELPLTVIFSRATIAELAIAVATKLAAPDHAPTMQGIPVAARNKAIPLSFSQERVWFLQQLDPTSLAYNSQTLLCFDGPLDIPVLRTCLNELIARHEILRTSFEEVHGLRSSGLRHLLR
jgi:amino acid adenylation domain-containing protein